MKQARQHPAQPSAFEHLLAACTSASFFQTPSRQSYVSLPNGSATPIYSEQFRSWVLKQAADQALPVPSPFRLAHVLRHHDNILQSSAAPGTTVHNRIAIQPDGCIYLDLQTAENEAIEVTRKNWTRIHHHPATFRRHELNLPLPVPTFSKATTTQLLAKSMGLTEVDANPLANWLTMALLPNVAAPILVITGEARIEAARLLRNIIDPVVHPLFPLPVTEGQLGQLAQWNNVLAFDAGPYITEGRKSALRRIRRGVPVRLREVSRRQSPIYETTQRPILIAADAAVEIEKNQINIEINQCHEVPLDQLLGALLNQLVRALKQIEAPVEPWHIDHSQLHNIPQHVQYATASKPFT